MFIVIAIVVLLVLGVACCGNNQPSGAVWDPPQRVLGDRAGNRRSCELDYMRHFASERLEEATASLRTLLRLVEAAQHDVDLTERFYRLDNELGAAIREYEHCLDRVASIAAIV